MQALRDEIVRRFGVTAAVAAEMIKKQSAKSRLKSSLTAALRLARGQEVTAEDDTNFEDDPQAWRQEVQRRMQAIEILEEGTKELKDLQKLVKRVMEAEQKLIASKIGSVNKKDDDWWDMQHSGWAMGGREMFAQKLFNILNGLDEMKLASYIMDKIGFKRSIPLDEEDIAPLVPMDLEPGQAMPGEAIPELEEEEAPVPADAEGVEAMLVRGAKAPKPKFKLGDKVTIKDLGLKGKVSFVGEYDDHLGQYRYKVKDENGGRKNWNENSLVRGAQKGPRL